MKKNEFAIIHELKCSQFLVDTNYEHGDEAPFKLTMKFWSKEFNGYASVSLRWADDDEKSFKRTFDELKDVAKAQEWFNKLNKIGQ